MKIAIVTGASSGMGRECIMQIADRFNGIGEIWAVARRKDRLEELIPRVPVKLRIFPMDITDSSSIEYLSEALFKAQPDVKFLVNAAGYGKIGPVSQVGLEDETGMVACNCEALCAVTKIVLPFMSKNSRIMNYASSAAFLPQPGFAVYAATKAFVLSYSRGLHEELKDKGIFVTAVCPGPVKTEFFDIAETTGTMPVYKKLVMADTKKVVNLAFRDSMMGRTVSVYGITMKAFRILCKVFPHKLLLKIMRSL